MTSTQQQISKANNSNKGCRYIRHRLLRNDVNVNFHWRSAGMADKSNFEKNLPNSQVDIRRPAGKIRKTPSDLDLQIRIKNLEEINLVDDSGEKCVTLKRYLIINLFYGRRNWRDSHCWKKSYASYIFQTMFEFIIRPKKIWLIEKNCWKSKMYHVAKPKNLILVHLSPNSYLSWFNFRIPQSKCKEGQDQKKKERNMKPPIISISQDWKGRRQNRNSLSKKYFGILQFVLLLLYS